MEATTASEMIKEIYMQAAKNVELESQKVGAFVLTDEQYDALNEYNMTLFADENGEIFAQPRIAGIRILKEGN